MTLGVRLLACALLIAVAIGAGMLAYGALSNLWADYRDSPTSTYLIVGLPAVAVCALALSAAVLVWRGH